MTAVMARTRADIVRTPDRELTRRALPRRDAASRIRVIPVDGTAPIDLPTLPVGLRVRSLDGSIDEAGHLRVHVLFTNGRLWSFGPESDRWEQEALGIERVHISASGREKALLRADGVIELVDGERTTRWTHPGRWSSLPYRSVLACTEDGEPAVYTLSSAGDLSVVRADGARLVDRRVSAVAAEPGENGTVVYARPQEFRVGRPDGTSTRLGSRFRDIRPWARTTMRAVTSTTTADGAVVVLAHDLEQNLHVWSSTAPACRYATLGEVTTFPHALADQRGVVATRGGSIRWVYPHGQTLPVEAGDLPGRARAVELRTAVAAGGERTVYARGSDCRLYSSHAGSSQWQLVADDVEVFDLIPGRAHIIVASTA
ncbi:hypothetical protein [Microbacterium sp. SLBN-111]|uniref:hypothetical protein n=1 Tax=Microbacterium sp. SLBN-111 TaxID=3377733 RepID=UPI003C7316D3